jgi:hypothetical protein
MRGGHGGQGRGRQRRGGRGELPPTSRGIIGPDSRRVCGGADEANSAREIETPRNFDYLT